jgi:hypothetical protein
MASATLCFSGFSRDDVALIQRQFEQANAELGNRWTLVPEADARVLIIDMDSMYGHMTWLKAQDGGKTTVGLTAGNRSETDFLLQRPVGVPALRALLEQLSDEAAVVTTRTPAVSPITAPAPAPVAAAAPAPSMPAPSAPAAEPAAATKAPSADYIAALTTGQMAAMQKMVPHEPRISDYMLPGVLGGPAKIQISGAPLLAMDPGSQSYAGSATLKPLLPYIEAVIRESEFIAISHTEFEQIKAAGGGAQPYMRLLWLCGLTVANGQLLPGFSPGRKFALTKWPQIEREYPKHFRLATVMMKGPALIREIAETSGVPEAEVVDFVNAGLLTGYVVVEGTTTTAGDVPKAVALLAKPRAG